MQTKGGPLHRANPPHPPHPTLHVQCGLAVSNRSNNKSNNKRKNHRNASNTHTDRQWATYVLESEENSFVV